MILLKLSRILARDVALLCEDTGLDRLNGSFEILCLRLAVELLSFEVLNVLIGLRMLGVAMHMGAGGNVFDFLRFSLEE